MTAPAIAAPLARTVRGGLLAGLASVVALRAPILLLFIASSALRFRFAVRG